jgi:hypothetical protein
MGQAAAATATKPALAARMATPKTILRNFRRMACSVSIQPRPDGAGLSRLDQVPGQLPIARPRFSTAACSFVQHGKQAHGDP